VVIVLTTPKKERLSNNQLYHFVPKTMVEYYDWMVLVCCCGTFINDNEKENNSILYFHFIKKINIHMYYHI